MPAFEIRPFHRADRDQVTRLVNDHAAAVMPGAGASVNAVLQQFEREPDEFIVGPWMRERRVLVAEQGGAVVAAALVVRYGDEAAVGPAYRGAGEIRWLLFQPAAPAGNPYWHDGQDAAEALMQACLVQFDRWQVTTRHADGALPVPGVYGVPEQWPHVARLYARHGFAASGVETVHLVDLAGIAVPPAPPTAPIPGLQLRRSVGINGTRFAAHLGTVGSSAGAGAREPDAGGGGERVGYLEVEVLDQAERHPRHGGLADIGNLVVVEQHRRRGVASWLLAHAAQWLRLGRVDRLLDYATPDETDLVAFLAHHGFHEVTRTRRGWCRPAG